MSVTVANLLKLPSLRPARLLAGAGGLSKIVSSVSVLEYADPDILQENLFNNNEFFGSEIVITGFINIKDNVDKQCANVRRLSEVGEVGLILYYVGIFMTSVDKRLIDLANELNFPLICMPENRMNLRYSEVICEVMETIFRDQMETDSLVTDVLERVSRLPSHQRTLDSVLKMISDSLRVSLLLTDFSKRVLNEVAWPRSLSGTLESVLHKTKLPLKGEHKEYSSDPRCTLYRQHINTVGSKGMELFIFKEGEPLTTELRKQMEELVQLSVNIWSNNHDEIAITELVRTILHDEPMRMRRLAEIFRVDVASIHTMWILRESSGRGKKEISAAFESLRAMPVRYCNTVVADMYEGGFVLFMDGPHTLSDINALTDAMLHLFDQKELKITMTRCTNLIDTACVRQAFLTTGSMLSDAVKVFPNQSVYDYNEILFVKDCREMIAQGEESIENAIAPLSALPESEMKQTISCFLLDARGSVSKTAQILFLHKNTIKYRMQKISDRYGFHVGSMPETMPLHYACAIVRLIN